MEPQRGRPPKDDEERRDIRFQIRVTQAEMTELERAAGGNTSTWAREILLRAAKRR
jgi:hypothetical protein